MTSRTLEQARDALKHAARELGFNDPQDLDFESDAAGNHREALAAIEAELAKPDEPMTCPMGCQPGVCEWSARGHALACPLNSQTPWRQRALDAEESVRQLTRALRQEVEATPFDPEGRPPRTEPVALTDSEEDPSRLWAEIHRLRVSVEGPAGYATWQDAATDERVRRVRAERALKAAAVPPGHVVVPVEPTEAIFEDDEHDPPMAKAWKALMIAARPKP